MKLVHPIFVLVCLLVLTIGGVTVTAQDTHESLEVVGVVIVTPDEIEWQDSAVAGVRSAVLVGNPADEEVYAIYGWMSEGSLFPPHAHPDDRLTTVVSGTMYYGVDDSFDEEALQAYPPGSVIYTPRGVPHFMWAPIDDVLSQETGYGPTGLLDESDWLNDGSLVTSATFVDITWRTGNSDGSRNVLMAGDPTTESMYALLGRMDEGAMFPVHAHPDTRVTTVIAGTMYFGVGNTYSEDAMHALPAGTLIYTPSGVPHFMWTPEGEMLSQEAGFGPTSLLDPEEWLEIDTNHE